MNPIISETRTLSKIVTNQNGKNIEVKLAFPETIPVSSLDDISDNGVYSGENIFTADMYENQFK